LHALFQSAQHLYEKREGSGSGAGSRAGSVSRAGSSSGSIPLTNGSGSARPKNIRIPKHFSNLRICNTDLQTLQGSWPIWWLYCEPRKLLDFFFGYGSGVLLTVDPDPDPTFTFCRSGSGHPKLCGSTTLLTLAFLSTCPGECQCFLFFYIIAFNFTGTVVCRFQWERDLDSLTLQKLMSKNFDFRLGAFIGKPSANIKIWP
jgi:hypothetical protein